MKLRFLALVCLLLLLSACGDKTPNPGKYEAIKIEENVYNIGNQWSRIPVMPEKISSYNTNTQRLLKAVSKVQTTISSGTTFYLGQHAGEFLFATNYHVIPDAAFCNFMTLITLSNGMKVTCKRLLASWPTVDIAFFIVRGAPEAIKYLEQTEALEFEFTRHPRSQEPLMVAGFGKHLNDKRVLTFSDDSLCRVASRYSKFHKVEGPDANFGSKVNGKKYTWSFMHGCEGSPGDSGSPLISRYSGKVVGVYWGGKTPKGNRMLGDSYVNDAIYKGRSKVIWKKFNMAVPVSKIRSKIRSYLNGNIRHNPIKKSVFSSLLQ